jgi:hypothetical protein
MTRSRRSPNILGSRVHGNADLKNFMSEDGIKKSVNCIGPPTIMNGIHKILDLERWEIVVERIFGPKLEIGDSGNPVGSPDRRGQRPRHPETSSNNND